MANAAAIACLDKGLALDLHRIPGDCFDAFSLREQL
jgi:hypothetical protein